MTETTQRSLAHAGFTLVRDYPVPVEDVWAAFAKEDQKKQWFGDGDAWSLREWRHEFRVGGHDIAEGQFHGGPRSRYEADYTDIVENNRIVTSYNMWIDGVHISTSVASFEFEAVDGGTRFTHTEHGIHLDGLDTGSRREEGTNGLLDALGNSLTR
jgi:uncharacterized protein YndB with AHSA1/START domain